MAVDVNRALQSLLSFYQEAGIDIAIAERPIDRFAETPPTQIKPVSQRSYQQSQRPTTPRQALAPSPPAKPVAATLSPEAAVMAARAAAREAASLEELRAIMECFEGCALRNTATRLVFSDGSPDANVMLVGEAPGRDEDLAGLPFVGRSGKLLDRMLQAIGLSRSSVYIANIIPWRPPGNRTPTPQESAICLPFIMRQIELVDPDLLVCLGGPSMQALLGIKDGITRMRGRWFNYHTGTREIRAIATLHPAYLLRQPLQKRLAWRDFLSIKKALGSL